MFAATNRFFPMNFSDAMSPAFSFIEWNVYNGHLWNKPLFLCQALMIIWGKLVKKNNEKCHKNRKNKQKKLGLKVNAHNLTKEWQSCAICKFSWLSCLWWLTPESKIFHACFHAWINFGWVISGTFFLKANFLTVLKIFGSLDTNVLTKQILKNINKTAGYHRHIFHRNTNILINICRQLKTRILFKF